MKADISLKVLKCLAFVEAGSEREASIALTQVVKLCRIHDLEIKVEPRQAKNRFSSFQDVIAIKKNQVGSTVDMYC